MLYVARVHGKFAAVYDGPCGERSILMNADLKPAGSRAEMQAKLDFWAGREGLEVWRG